MVLLSSRSHLTYKRLYNLIRILLYALCALGHKNDLTIKTSSGPDKSI